jgi:hypothetical protein
LGHDHAGPLGLGATKDRSGLGNRALFLAVVVLPTLLTAIYMLAIASNQYISEAHFIVRSAQKQNAGGLTAMLQGSGLSGIRDEASSVIDPGRTSWRGFPRSIAGTPSRNYSSITRTSSPSCMTRRPASTR